MGIACRMALLGAVAFMGCGQVPGHVTGLALGGQACFDCHGDRYLATTDPDHAALGYPSSCEGCHATAAWRPATASNHDFWPLTGAHVTATCMACHTDGFEGTPTECAGCHLPDYQSTTDPDHVASALPTACEACHSTTAWQPASLDHDQFWPIRGKHTVAECASCHVNNVYAGTPRDCFGCHQPDYDATTDPNHVAGNIPTTCDACHSVDGWRPATLDHDQFWPIRGKHEVAECSDCHVNNVYNGTPRDCVGCHQQDYNGTTDPNHIAEQFPTACEACHSVDGWKPAAYDHDQYWPLQGKHATATCASCHVGGVYAGTPKQCVACHQGDYNGAASPSHTQLHLSTACETCHTPTSWATNKFPQHDSLFPITSGKHRNFTCGECHTTPNTYSAFTCTGCHTGEHNLNKMNQEHQGEVANYQATLNQYGVDRGCLHCHPDGRD